jgi:GTP-binding protein
VNKIDRPNARLTEVVAETQDLFLDLATEDHQLDFPVLYANARDGYAAREPGLTAGSLQPLFETILEHIPGPLCDEAAPFRMLATTLAYDTYRGRTAIGRVVDGVIHPADMISRWRHDASTSPHRIAQVFGFQGLSRTELTEGRAGDIIAITGIPDILIGETIASPEAAEPLPPITIEEPAMKMTFRINDSPFAGREGQFVTSRHLRERLYREVETRSSSTRAPTGSKSRSRSSTSRRPRPPPAS